MPNNIGCGRNPIQLFYPITLAKDSHDDDYNLLNCTVVHEPMFGFEKSGQYTTRKGGRTVKVGTVFFIQ